LGGAASLKTPAGSDFTQLNYPFAQLGAVAAQSTVPHEYGASGGPAGRAEPGFGHRRGRRRRWTSREGTTLLGSARLAPGTASLAAGSHPIVAVYYGDDTFLPSYAALTQTVNAAAGLTLGYQTTNPATNALTGTPDTPASIAPSNGVQSFFVSFQGTSAVSAPGMALDFACDDVAPAAIDLVMSGTPVADIIALAATPSSNGISELPAGAAAAFAVASTNVGVTAPIIVSIDTGTATLRMTATICQSNPGTGQCLATPAAAVSPSFAAGATPTFSVFLQATGTIPFAPAS
jgi:hypothetical protein